MGTLQELVRYCREERHLGALLLTGEWGCGKTYLIETELSEALRSTHFLVRISLLGVDSINALNNAVKKQWLYTCTPLMGRLNQQKEQATKNTSFINATNSLLRSFNPLAGNIASAVAAFDPIEYVQLETEVEDHHNGGEKKEVILIFDDLDRSKLDIGELVGCINEYCENKGFKTIIIANEEAIRAKIDAKNGLASYMMIKEKTIARTVRYIPDFQGIVHSVITQDGWPSQEYAAFLSENEAVIFDAFASDPPRQKDGPGRYHNIRSLICALQEFYRVYSILAEERVTDMARYLYSFIVFMLVSRTGISKVGQPCFQVSEEEIKRLYPAYSSDAMPESIRQWIANGIWQEDLIAKSVSRKRKSAVSEPRSGK